MTDEFRKEKMKLLALYHQQNLVSRPKQIVFTGSSLMEMFPIQYWYSEYSSSPIIYNRGVGGWTTLDFLDVIDICVLQLQPKAVYINIGTNDLSDPSITLDEMTQRYDQILSIIQEHLPDCKLTLMAYYPVNPSVATGLMKQNLAIRTNQKILKANSQIFQLAQRHHARYLDVTMPLKDSEGCLRADFTLEGMHINNAGYRAIFPLVMQHVLEGTHETD